MASSAREAALTALIAWRRGGAWSDGFLKDIIKKDRMDARDAALASRLCFGVLQELYLLDYYIEKFCTTKPEKLQPVVRDILRLGLYQLLFMDRIPQNAAVNEAVQSAKVHANAKAAGMVNGVLRSVCRSMDKLPEPQELWIKYSHPKWLCDTLERDYGRDRLEPMLMANNTVPPTVAQVNTYKFSVAEAIELLEADGVEVARHPWLEGCLLISDTGNIETLTAFSAGAIMIQDAAAKLTAEVAGVKPGDTVIDGCAAPGGKSFAAAIRMNDEGKVLSFDIHQHKIQLIEKSAQRLGLACVEAAVGNAKSPDSSLLGLADVVLADVPCSGLGVIRKKPDIRYKQQKDIAGLPDIQMDILRGLSSCVKPGGCLVYSTCTVIKAENEGVVSRFLESDSSFEPEPFTLPGPNMDGSSGMLTLLPDIHDTDGFFICKLRKKLI